MKNRNPFHLKNSICVVAGASGLLGKSIADTLERLGAKVIGLDTKKSKKRTSIQLDITNERELELFFQTLKSGAKANWAFINCSYPRTPNWGTLNLENVKLSDFSENVNMHLGSAFIFARESAKFLKKQGGGSILNFGSIYGVNGPDLRIYKGTKMQNPSPYSAIKGGICGLTKYIATTYGKHQVRANAICPGGIFDHQPKSFVREYESRTPLGRMANPEDISGVAAFLVSPAGSYITGQILMVDGGWSAW